MARHACTAWKPGPLSARPPRAARTTGATTGATRLIGAAGLALAAVGPVGAQTCADGLIRDASPNPAFAEVVRLRNVAVVAPDDIWAVGLARDVPPPPESSTDLPLTMHFDGVSWSIVETPAPAAPGELHDVAAVASDEVYACGGGAKVGDSSVWIMRWDGIEWRMLFDDSFVVPEDDAVLLEGADVLDAQNIWFAGGGEIGGGLQKGTLFRFDGSEFQRFTTPQVLNAAHRLRSVSALAPDDVWAAGAAGGVGVAVGVSYVVHFDGERWEHVPTPHPGDREILWDIVAIAPDDVWATGKHSSLEPLLLHWDGGGWTEVDAPMVANDLVAIASDDIYGVNGSRVMHWDGASWSIVAELDDETVAFDGIERVGGCGHVIVGWDSVGSGMQESLVVRFGGCLADFDGDGVVDTRDVLAFLNVWSAQGDGSDFDGDGAIDTRDVLAFLNAWNSGC